MVTRRKKKDDKHDKVNAHEHNLFKLLSNVVFSISLPVDNNQQDLLDY